MGGFARPFVESSKAMERLRRWYRSPENEPLRREVAWSRGWMLRGWPLVGLLIITIWAPMYLRLVTRLAPTMVSQPPSTAAIHIGISTAAYIVPELAIVWLGWFVLMKRRALLPMAPGRREELLVTPLDFSRYVPALLTAPLLWLTIVNVCRTIAQLLVDIVYPDPFLTAIYTAVSWEAAYYYKIGTELSGALESLVFCWFATIVVFWIVLTNPRPYRVALLAIVLYIAFWVIEVLLQVLPHLFFRTRASAEFAGKGLSAMLVCSIFGFVARHYLLKLGRQETRDRLATASSNMKG